jgi:hypothetical protein
MKDIKLKKYQENFSAYLMINGEWENVIIKKNTEVKDSMRVIVFQGRYRSKAEHITLLEKIIEVLKMEF